MVKVENLGIEHLSVFGLPPVEFVGLAADLGCRYIATGLTPFPFNPHGYPPYSLRDNGALRREMCAAMRDRDVSISLGEGISVRPSREISDSARDMDIMKELGVGRINAVSLDPDRNRTFDQLGLLADMAESREMRVTLEFVPGLVIGDLPQAVAAVQHVGRAHVAVLIDTMHLVRSGSGAAELAALDPALIGYVQMCDVLLIPLIENYGEEAMFERMVPGEGELPLCDIMGALPDDAIVGLEVPLRAAAEAGEDTRSRVQRCVQGARTVLGRAG